MTSSQRMNEMIPTRLVHGEGRVLLITKKLNEATQIPQDPKDQEKTTGYCPSGTFAYVACLLGYCNAALARSKDGMMAIFQIMIEKGRCKVFIG
ncbi:hypothetical protein Tco_1194945 [Tanacetum coccineum]